MYAISLGGDSDTIATMTGAIAGACYRIENIPKSWLKCCEGTEDALTFASDLHALQRCDEKCKADSEVVDCDNDVIIHSQGVETVDENQDVTMASLAANESEDITMNSQCENVDKR